MTKEKITKKQMVLDYLRKHGDITPIEAWQEFDVMRLADLIFQAKKAGWQINTEPQYRTNRAGQNINYAKYVLVSDPEGNAFQKSVDYMSHKTSTKLVQRPVRYKKGEKSAACIAKDIINMNGQELKTQNLFDE
jgi:hypothetical protein